MVRTEALGKDRGISSIDILPPRGIGMVHVLHVACQRTDATLPSMSRRASCPIIPGRACCDRSAGRIDSTVHELARYRD